MLQQKASIKKRALFLPLLFLALVVVPLFSHPQRVLAGPPYEWRDASTINITTTVTVGRGVSTHIVNFSGSVDSSNKGTYTGKNGSCTATLTVTYNSTSGKWQAVGKDGGKSSSNCGMSLTSGDIGDPGHNAPTPSTPGGSGGGTSGGSSGGGSTSSSCTTDNNGNCKTSSDSSTLSCGSSDFDWLICGLINICTSAANKLDSFIMNTLDVDIKPIFDTGPSHIGYYKAWNSFRIIASAMLVIAGLVMVASQALGFELLDAYTIRKVLPRLLVAVIGISLSWPLMRLAVSFFDTLGLDIRELMYAPFKDMGGTILTAGIFSWLIAGAALFVIGPASLTFILTALLAIFVGFLVLVVREVAIIMLIIVAPVAIAAYILPNTQKAWKLWSENFFGLLMMFPIISALIAAGHIFAAVSAKGISDISDPGSAVTEGLALVAYFAPYFLIPMAARVATGIIGSLAGFVNDRHRGAFDRLKGIRENSRKQRHQMRMAGQTKFGGSKLGSVYRRGAMVGTPNSGALSVTRQGRANFQAAEQRLLAHTADEMLKNDNGRSAGDDLANSLALQRGMTANKFVSEYTKGLMAQDPSMSESDARNRARASLASIQSNYGATMGSSAMRVAAFKAKAASTTGYRGDESAWEEREKDAVSLMNDGLITTTDAAAAFKSNAKRQDQAGVGFGDIMKQLESVKAGKRLWSNEEMIDKAVSGSQPGALLAGHKNAVAAAAPAMLRRLEKAYASGDNIEINRQLAEIAGRYDVMSQISPDSARVMAEKVMAMPAGTTGTTVQDAIERARTNPDFVSMRREYGSAERAAAAAAAAAPGGGYGPPPPGGIPPVGS